MDMRIYEKIEKTVQVLKEMMVVKRIPCNEFKFQNTTYKKNNIIPEVDDTWKDLPESMLISGNDMHFWIIGEITTPSVGENEYVVLEFKDKNPRAWIQACLYVNGEMYQEYDSHHFGAKLESNKKYTIAIYIYYDQVRSYTSILPEIQVISKAIEKLYYDLQVPCDAMSVLDRESTEYKTLEKHLQQACNRIDFRKEYDSRFWDSIHNATAYMKEEFYDKECGKENRIVHCIGQSHIDVAWMWPLRQTKEKIQRTVSMVLRLMKEYPEYCFMLTQPQLLQFLKEEAPELYKEVEKRVEEGRFEVEGAMWLEADGNLPSGESFIRQILVGKKYLKKEFDKDSKVYWIPDVFGYSAALPQILKKCGVDYFVTGKISWNDRNRMPNDSFYWQGIDGSEIFTQFLTTKDFTHPDKSHDYVNIAGEITARDIKSSWDVYKNKEYNSEVICTYGYGDGGGGPSREMLERQRRYAYGLPGMGMTKLSSVKEFLSCAKKNFDENCGKLQKTPRWCGELYLEYHRGTYTSMAKNKKKNRQSEFLLHNVELLAVDAMLLKNVRYPKEKLDCLWQKVLLNQFHDIIPGSSIKEVYEDSDKDYAYIQQEGENLLKDLLDQISKEISTDGGYMIYNPTSYTRSDLVLINEKTVYVKDIPAYGWRIVKDFAETNEIVTGSREIASPHYIVKWNEKGNITSIYDKEFEQEIIISGKEANRLEAYEDMPLRFEAWEITNYYEQKTYEIEEVLSCKEICDGERKGIQIIKKYGDSEIIQNIWLHQFSRRIDFETVIDWKEKNTLVKAMFPLNIHTDKITSEIQFGNVERVTHQNTSWDEAKYEMCMHKWIDVSDNNYGIGILNDCKYGYSAKNNEIGISLLKCAVDPNPDADKEIHRFTYSLYPHKGRYYQSDLVKEAYNLNNPLFVRKIASQAGRFEEDHSLVSADKDNIIIETIKQAEDGEGIILRLYDAHNMTVKTKLCFGFKVKDVWLCDMLENEVEAISVEENTICLRVHNFEIITLKVKWK